MHQCGEGGCAARPRPGSRHRRGWSALQVDRSVRSKLGCYSISLIEIAPPSIFTSCLLTPTRGSCTSVPVLISYDHPCHGQVTTSLSIWPSQSGPALCRQRLSMAWKSSPKRNRATWRPLTTTILPWPDTKSSTFPTTTKSAKLLACRRRERGFPLFAAAHVDHLRGLADLQQLQRVGVVVDVGDRLAGDLDDHIALLQPGLLGRPAANHAAEQ